MKTCFLCAVLCIVCCLMGCVQPPVPSESTAVTTGATTEPSMEVSSSVATDPEVPVWTPVPREQMGYEEYLSEARIPSTYGGLRWIGADGVTEYQIDYMAEGFGIFNYDSTGNFNYYWTVPDTKDCGGYAPLKCDGYWLYCSGNAKLFRIELLTGNREVLFTADRMLDGLLSASTSINTHLIDWDWLYFLAKKDGAVGLYRLYLPEMKLDLLHNGIPGDILTHGLLLETPESTGKIEITYINPDLQPLLLEAWRDPQSIYNTVTDAEIHNPWIEPEVWKIDFPAIWGEKRYETALFWDPWFDVLSVLIQNDSNIPARRLCTYNSVTGQVTDVPAWATACDNIHSIIPLLSFGEQPEN